MDETEGDAPAFCLYFCAAPEGSRRSPSNGGREGYKGELGGLARPYTPYVVPEALEVVAVGTQETTIVVQAVLTVATVRSRGPPVSVCRAMVERAIEVVPASNRRKSGYVATASNAPKFFIIGW